MTDDLSLFNVDGDLQVFKSEIIYDVETPTSIIDGDVIEFPVIDANVELVDLELLTEFEHAEIISDIESSSYEFIIEVVSTGKTGAIGKAVVPITSDTGVITWQIVDTIDSPPADIDLGEILKDGVIVDLVGTTTFTHEQASASDKWVIIHNMNFYPTVTTVTYGKNQILGEVQYIDKNHLEVTFSTIMSGYAYLS